MFPAGELKVGKQCHIQQSPVVAAFIGYRLTGFFEYLGRNTGPAADQGEMQWLSGRLDAISAIDLLGRIELWAGVLAAVGLIFVAVRMRRYRDDT